MIEPPSLFSAWESFYVIVGSSGAALTGLQFVVMALIADAHRKGSAETIGAFGTPTIVHFCVVLATASILSATWERVGPPAALLAFIGIYGVGYAIVVTMRARRQRGYKPVLEDWIWHSLLPFVAYLMLVIGALMTAYDHRDGLFAVAGTSLLLLLIGIHNAWDSSAYVASGLYRDSEAAEHVPTTAETPSLERKS